MLAELGITPIVAELAAETGGLPELGITIVAELAAETGGLAVPPKTSHAFLRRAATSVT